MVDSAFIVQSIPNTGFHNFLLEWTASTLVHEKDCFSAPALEGTFPTSVILSFVSFSAGLLFSLVFGSVCLGCLMMRCSHCPGRLAVTETGATRTFPVDRWHTFDRKSDFNKIWIHFET